jgi:hypothetical protein
LPSSGYNEQHHHAERPAHRALALRAAFQLHPERFPNGRPFLPNRAPKSGSTSQVPRVIIASGCLIGVGRFRPSPRGSSRRLAIPCTIGLKPDPSRHYT